MIDIDIHFEDKKDRDLAKEFAELPDALRKNVYFVAHVFSMVGQSTLIKNIKQDAEGDKSVVVFPLELNGRMYNRYNIPKHVLAVNNMFGRPHSNPFWEYNPFTKPCTFEVWT